MEKIYFKEEQKFDQWWFRLIIFLSFVPVMVIFGVGLYQQLVLKKPFGNNPTSDTALILTAVFIFFIMCATWWLTLAMKLITEVTDKGVTYRFPPLILKKRIIYKESIQSFEVRKYNPIGEYGGWGIKGSGFRRGKAYNVKGNMGLQLVLKDGKKILFGTQRTEAIKSAMDKMMNPIDF
jgi:hypothetical protein